MINVLPNRICACYGNICLSERFFKQILFICACVGCSAARYTGPL
jgi:hypothetical protein